MNFVPLSALQKLLERQQMLQTNVDLDELNLSLFTWVGIIHFAITTTVGQKLMDKVICKLALGRMWYPRNR